MKVETYKDSEWLYNERFRQRRTTDDIAKSCGVSRKTIEHFIKKFSIPAPPRYGEIEVEIRCGECGGATYKKLSYLVQRVRTGHFKFFCTRECTDKFHSKNISGENNPNFAGTWNGPPHDMIIDREKLRENALRTIQALKDSGTYDDRMEEMHRGHKRFFSTERGRALRRANGVKSALIQSSGKRTSIEVKMADELSRRFVEYIEQYNLGNKFALDFFIPKYGIVIECDGDYWHRRPEAIRRDKAKNAYIRACGYSLYRFWESEINTDVAACVDVVMAEINDREEVS